MIALADESHIDWVPIRGSYEELEALCLSSKAPKVRPIRQFAEEEITVPTGPHANLKFRLSRQPFVRHWFDAIDSGRYEELVCTGPSQSGKSLAGFVIPALWHLFEHKETIILALPDLNMAADKWQLDILPVLQKTQYAKYIPMRGRGLTGGKVEAIHFTNGATLKFMSGGGSDKTRAYFTARVVIFTEVNAMAKRQLTSKESNQINQIIARTRAFGSARRVYKECTVEDEHCHIWQRKLTGTNSRILMPCQHCGEYVAPERDHLKGYESADNEFDAENSWFYCPKCDAQWSDEDRFVANNQSVIVHKGQDIEKGEVVGDHPKTKIFGFRWSAVHNQFAATSDLGRELFLAQNDIDEQNAEREQCQFVWCIPYQSPDIMTERIDIDVAKDKVTEETIGILPEWTDYVTVGCDINQDALHWTAMAWGNNGMSHIHEYGRYETRYKEIGAAAAILEALRDLRDKKWDSGWRIVGKPEPRWADHIWIDAGWHADWIHQFIKDDKTSDWYKPCLGRGTGHQMQRYTSPKATRTDPTMVIGEQYHINWVPDPGVYRVFINADHWKLRVHHLLMLGQGERGSTTLYHGMKNEHINFLRHLTAEEYVKEWIEGKGWQWSWKKIRGNNHWLDSTYLACGAGSFAGFKYVPETRTDQRHGSLTLEPAHLEALK